VKNPTKDTIIRKKSPGVKRRSDCGMDGWDSGLRSAAVWRMANNPQISSDRKVAEADRLRIRNAVWS